MKRIILLSAFVLACMVGYAQKSAKEFCLDNRLTYMAEGEKGEALVQYVFDVRQDVVLSRQTYTFDAVLVVRDGTMSIHSVANTGVSEGLRPVSTEEYEGLFKTNLSKAQWEKLVEKARGQAQEMVNKYNNK